MLKPITIALSLLLLGTPLTALAWGSYVTFQERWDDFEFTGVELQSPNSGPKRCVVKVTLTYRAPTAETHRFLAQVETSGGQQLSTTFTSQRKSARATHRFSIDTGPNGCWAADMQKPRNLKVAGCKGEKCTPR